MNFKPYLEKFKAVADQLDKQLLHKKGIEVAVGVVLDSAFLKLYKKSWANPSQDPLTAQSRIFFSVWVNDSTIATHKIFYNIHALKLRQLKGYSIQSTKFASIFRARFKDFEQEWPNVSTKFGPLTLMEGWIKMDLKNFQEDVTVLAERFLAIENLIDDTMTDFK